MGVLILHQLINSWSVPTFRLGYQRCTGVFCGHCALNLPLLCGNRETESSSSEVVNALPIPPAPGLWLSPRLDIYIILCGMMLQWWAPSQAP